LVVERLYQEGLTYVQQSGFLLQAPVKAGCRLSEKVMSTLKEFSYRIGLKINIQ
jgi:hypothetical protein